MTEITEKQRAAVFVLLGLLLCSLSSSWLAQQVGWYFPVALPAFLALACLFAMLFVFVRAGALRLWFFAAFAGMLSGLLLLPALGYI